MANNPNKKIHFYNKWCISILERFEYTVSKELELRGLWKHLGLLAVSSTMFVISFVSVETIRTYVFLFHLLCLFQKWAITYFHKRNCEKAKSQNPIGTRRLKITSPYHKLSEYYMFSFLFLLFVSALSFLKVPHIDPDVVYSIVVYLSILITFLHEVFDSIVVLYNASAQTRKIR